jgi:tetratricopeptide (TPR) repeat protein
MRRGRGAWLYGLLLVVALGAGDPGRGEDPDLAPAGSATAQRGRAYAHLMRSLLAAKRGEFREARDEIGRAIALQPTSAAVHLQGAQLLKSMGRYASAEELAREALRLDPDSLESLRLLAQMGYEQALSPRGDARSAADALALYDELVRRGAVDGETLLAMAQLQVHSGNVGAAVDTARRLAQERPGDDRATRLLYRLLVETDQEAEALQVLLRFLSGHAAQPELMQEADRLASKLDAWETVAELLAQAPDGVGGAQALRGEALLRLQRIDEATRALEQALRADAADQAVRLRLTWAYRMAGRLADAAKLARGLVDDQPTYPDFRLILAETLDRQRDTDAAVDEYVAALALFAEDSEDARRTVRDGIRRRLAAIHAQRQRLDLAREMLESLESPDEAEGLEMLGRLALLDQDWATARQVVRRLHAAEQHGAAALIEGEVLARNHRFGKAEARFGEALAQLGPYTRVSVAETWREVGRPLKGEKLLRDWISEHAEDADAHFELGRYLYALDRPHEAEASMREAFRIDPRHAAALNFVGYSLAERNERLDEALELVLRALRVDAWDGAYLDSLGWVYYQLGLYREAREPLERAAREYPTDPIILDHLGDLYARLGEWELAEHAWSRVLEADPDRGEALRTKLANVRERRLALESAVAVDPAQAQAPIHP